MDKIMGGATIWARQTLNSDIFFWKPDKWFKIWFYIVNRVNHQDTKLFKRGTAYIDYAEIAKNTKSTYGQIQSFIRFAKKTQMLSTQKSTRGNIITVHKYNVFQNFNNYKIQAGVEAQSKHNPSTIHAINNNVKNDKNEKKRESVPSSNYSYLTAIPDSDMEEYITRFSASEKEIRSKAESLYLYCESKGRQYKNYKAFLLNALKKDFKERQETQKSFIIKPTGEKIPI